MTQEEIKQLAIDTFKNKVFFSTMIGETEGHLIQSIFMPIVFMKQEQIDKLKEDKVVAFYEYYDQASPRSINGYPMFISFKTITQPDLDEVHRLVEKLQEVSDEL